MQTHGLLLVAAFFLMLGNGFAAPDAPAPAPNPGPGETAPPWQLKDLSDRTVQLSDFKGKVVLLDFWTTWNPENRANVSHLVALQKQGRDKGWVVVSVAVDEVPDVIAAFVKAHHEINYPILVGDYVVRSEYGGITDVPMMFVIDRNGIIQSIHQGPLQMDALQKELKKLL